MIAVQIVTIVWTKATRGAPRSNERAALPRAYAIPRNDAPYCVQYHGMHEGNGFRPLMHTEHRGETVRPAEDVLLFQLIDPATLQVGLSSNGQPYRAPVSRAFDLRPGEYGRLATNGRHASHSGQWYTETICHVAFGDGIPADRFIASAPDCEYSQMAHLF